MIYLILWNKIDYFFVKVIVPFSLLKACDCVYDFILVDTFFKVSESQVLLQLVVAVFYLLVLGLFVTDVLLLLL